MAGTQALPGTVVPSGAYISPGGGYGAQGPIGAAGAPGVAGQLGNEDVGTIKAWPSVTPPASWMLADGSAVSRTLYPQLFNLIGSAFGPGDGITTFNLPDMRGKFILGAGLGTGLTQRNLAASGGEESHLLSIAEMPAHGHIQDPHNHAIQSNAVGYGSGGYAQKVYCAAASADAVATVTATNQNTGGGGTHNTMPPFLVLTYIIKVSPTGGSTAQAPLADTTQPGLVTKMSGLATDYVGGDNATHDLSWLGRRYNAVINPAFEVDARTAGAGMTSGTGGWVQDKWQYFQQGTNRGTCKQTAATGGVIVGATNFCVSSQFLRYTLTTQQTSLAATDYIVFQQVVEGSVLRPLFGGPTAQTIVCRSSVAPLKFAVKIQDNAGAYTLLNLVNLSTANVWTLIPIPSIPTFTPSGTFSMSPGVMGAYIGVAIAAGPSAQASASNVWQAGNFNGVVGMDNFAAQATGSTFDIGFFQWEPGATSNGVINSDFVNERFRCHRYYFKSYEDGTAIQTATTTGEKWMHSMGAGFAMGSIMYPAPMAKVGTVTTYLTSSPGTANQVTSWPGSVVYNVAGVENTTKSVDYLSITSGVASQSYRFHLVSDTGW